MFCLPSVETEGCYVVIDVYHVNHQVISVQTLVWLLHTLTILISGF